MWAAFAAALAEAGKPYLDAGLAFGYHNHHWEFTPQNGALPIDLLLAGDGVQLEFDVAWGVKAGVDPLDIIGKYADKMYAAHIKDIAAAGECEDEDGWADVGHGTMDWAGLMAALRATRAKYFVMEHDNPNDDKRFASRSIAAAKAL